MALALKDRVKETTIVVGTGAATLLGSSIGFQPFSVVGNGNTTYYCISDQFGTNWEVGIGTYTSSGNTLARTTVLASSNAGALVVFTTGVKDVFVTYPSEKGVWLDASNNAIGLGTPAAFVGTNITGTASGLTAGNVTTNANLTGAITSSGNATSLGSFTSANLATALTDETGSGANVFATSPTLVTPALGTPTSGILTNCTLPQLSASTGSTLVGTTNGGTGSVTRTVASKLNDTVSVKDFGAVGDGVTDDAVAIQASITYAVANGKSIFFPDGNYKVNTGLILYPGCGVQTAGNASITAGAAITILTLSSGNYTQTPLSLPALYSGTNGLNLYGANLAVIFVPSISGCSANALTLTVDNTYGSCADNTITFDAISSCITGAGIKFSYLATTTSGKLMQGNAFYGNFITSVKYGIHFYDVNNGSLANIAWDDTYFQIIAIDPNVSGSIGIYGEPYLPPGRTTYYIPGFFGGYDTAAIKGGANNNLFKLAFSTITYAQMQLAGIGNRIINCGSGQQGIRGVSTPIAMTTASGTIATYNGGITPYANRFYSSLTIGTALTSVVITGTAGQFSCASTALAVGQPITITGTFGGTGSITGYTTGATYYIITTNSTTTFTLSATYGGSAITTTAGTPTGLTYNAGLGPLQAKPFAFYHSFMQVYGCRVYAEPLWATTPMVITGAFENSTVGAGVGQFPPNVFMGEVDVLAVGPVLAATYKLFICVHDASQ